LRVFSQYKVEYLIIGGYAVAFHAEPRFTKDLDILVRASQENARRVFQALRAFGAPLSGLTEKDFEREKYCYQIGAPPVRVDILMSIDGVVFDDAWARRVESTIGDVEAFFMRRLDRHQDGDGEAARSSRRSNSRCISVREEVRA
jgi:hypothetical protein